MNKTSPIVHAILLTAPGCAHCPGVLNVLSTAEKDGRLASLEVVDIAVDAQRATELGVRTVPWFSLNELEFEGAYSEAEINSWITHAGTDEGLAILYDDLLGDGQMPRVEVLVRKHPHTVSTLLSLLEDDERRISVRIGVGAVIEGLEGTGLLTDYVAELGKLTQHSNISTRIDAYHYLSLTDNREAIPYLRAALDDTHPDVRETVIESLEVFGEEVSDVISD